MNAWVQYQSDIKHFPIVPLQMLREYMETNETEISLCDEGGVYSYICLFMFPIQHSLHFFHYLNEVWTGTTNCGHPSLTQQRLRPPHFTLIYCRNPGIHDTPNIDMPALMVVQNKYRGCEFMYLCGHTMLITKIVRIV